MRRMLVWNAERDSKRRKGALQLKMVWHRYKLNEFWSFSFLSAPYESYSRKHVKRDIDKVVLEIMRILGNRRSTYMLASEWQDQGIRLGSTNMRGKKWSSKRREYTRTSRRASCAPQGIAKIRLNRSRGSEKTVKQLMCKITFFWGIVILQERLDGLVLLIKLSEIRCRIMTSVRLRPKFDGVLNF